MDQPEHEAQESDGAEQAFVALREEVAALRRGVELVYRQGQEPKGRLLLGRTTARRWEPLRRS